MGLRGLGDAGADERGHGHAGVRGHTRRQGGLPPGEVGRQTQPNTRSPGGGLRVAPAALGLPPPLPPAARMAGPTRATRHPCPWRAQPSIACACVACAHGPAAEKLNDVTLAVSATVCNGKRADALFERCQRVTKWPASDRSCW